MENDYWNKKYVVNILHSKINNFISNVAYMQNP